MDKVILKPCELHVESTESGKIVYAGLWDIQSSDNRVHDIFCELAEKLGVFGFGNTGIRVEDDKPLTWDDGSRSLEWLKRFLLLRSQCKLKGIVLVIEFNKKFVQGYGVDLDFGVYYNNKDRDKIISTYFKALGAFFSHLGMKNPLMCRCNLDDALGFNYYQDRIYIFMK